MRFCGRQLLAALALADRPEATVYSALQVLAENKKFLAFTGAMGATPNIAAISISVVGSTRFRAKPARPVEFVMCHPCSPVPGARDGRRAYNRITWDCLSLEAG